MSKPTRKDFPGSRLIYILSAYAIAIFFFTLFRIANSIIYCNAQPTDLEGLYGQALFMGWRFDTLVSCFVLALPLLMVIIGEIAHIRAKAYYAVAHHMTVTLFIICFFACAADIPYFNYFFTRLNAQAVDWGDEASMVIDMIISEPTYIGYFFAFLSIAAGYWFLMRWVYRRLLKPCASPRWLPLGYSIPLAILLIAACFVGMRGRLQAKSPMRVGTAYFCNNAFLNQIGLNPVFTFIKSIEDQGKRKSQPIALMDEEEARSIIETQLSKAITPLHDTIALPEGTNVVLVLMESMSADKVGFLSPASDLTPNIDSLMSRSLAFTQAYSAGIHTHNGLFSTLFSYPAILNRHIMKEAVIPQMCGLPHALSSNGYRTLFFITHDSEFDNMNGFLLGNGIEKLFSQQDYPSSEVTGTWGVPDHIMFNHAIEELGKLDNSQPFLACLLTCSDHGPFIYPENIELQPRHSDLRQKIVEYADWSIGQFMHKAAQQPWFDNTLFVFVADHGSILNSRYDMPLSYHHEPLFFYYPKLITPQQTDRLACQIDLTPTLLGMLPVSWNNNTLGIDLLRQQRPYVYFSADDKIGVLDQQWFYIYRMNEGRESMYRYRTGDTHDYLDQEAQRADDMRRYAFSMIQTTQSRLRDHKTLCQ